MRIHGVEPARHRCLNRGGQAIDTNQNDRTPALTLGQLIERVDALGGEADLVPLQAILILAVEALGMAEMAFLEDVIRARLGLSQRTVAAFTKEARNHCFGHGYLHTPHDVADAYIQFFNDSYEDLVWVEGCLYSYEASASVGSEIDSQSSEEECGGYYQRTTYDELMKHMVETFGDLPALRSEASRKEVLNLMRLRLQNDDFFVDARPGVNLRDGFLTMYKDGQLSLLPHSTAHKARMRIESEYDPAAETGWLDHAMAVTLPDEASRHALQEIAAAILFNIWPAKDAVRGMFVLYGARNSGKSTLIALLASLLPKAVIGSIAPEHWGDPVYRAGFEGMLLNIVTELGRGPFQSEQAKKIVSREMITGKVLYRGPVCIVPVARHLFAANELFHIPDESNAFERRVLVVTFARSLEGDLVDGGFLEKLKANPSAVLNWAAAGARRLMAAERFTIPPGHLEAAAEIQHGRDFAMVFAHTQLRAEAGSRTTTVQLRKALQAFADARGVTYTPAVIEGAVRKVALFVQKKHSAIRHKNNGKPFYEGVALVSPEPPSDDGGPQETDLADM